jgi:hypothetical protein
MLLLMPPFLSPCRLCRSRHAVSRHCIDGFFFFATLISFLRRFFAPVFSLSLRLAADTFRHRPMSFLRAPLFISRRFRRFAIRRASLASFSPAAFAEIRQAISAFSSTFSALQRQAFPPAFRRFRADFQLAEIFS